MIVDGQFLRCSKISLKRKEADGHKWKDARCFDPCMRGARKRTLEVRLNGASKKRIVFVIGAGASVHAGIPVLKDFMLRTFTLLEAEKLCPGTTGLGGHGSDFPDFQRVMDAWVQWARKSWNIEEFFQYVDDNQGTEDMRQLRVELIWTMFRTIQLSEERFRNRQVIAFGYAYRPIEIYGRLATQINNMITSNTQVQIITLNWDILLDQALMRRGIRPEYYLEHPVHCNKPIGEIPVDFLKIHGSVNWRAYIDRRTDEVRVHWDHGPGNWHTGEAKERGMKSYLLVPPSDKGRRDQLLKPVRDKAASAVRNADCLVFLGIGFPPTDTELACEFSKWASKRFSPSGILIAE